MILNKNELRSEYAGLGSQRLMSLDMYTTKHINRLKPYTTNELLFELTI